MMVPKEKNTLKVAICTPTAGIVHAGYCMSLTKMILHFLQTPVLAQEYSEKHVVSQMQVGANIGENRDNMVGKALEQECTHVLFIDDDMGFTADCLNIMLARQMPVLLANYRRKIPPGRFTARNKDNTDEIITTKDSTSLTECYYGGFGFCLIETEVLKAIKRPRFLQYFVPEFDCYTTEDLPFFNEVHKAGFPVFVDQEVSKRVWHCGPFNYGFDQVLPAEWSVPYPERVNLNA